jgi:hypothetical protein
LDWLTPFVHALCGDVCPASVMASSDQSGWPLALVGCAGWISSLPRWSTQPLSLCAEAL